MAHDGTSRDYELPHTAPFTNEGKTKAGWLMFWGVSLGALVTALGVILWEQWVMIVGVVLLVLTVVTSRVLAGMGLGQPRDRDREAGAGQPDWYA